MTSFIAHSESPPLTFHCRLLVAKSSTYSSIQSATQTIVNVITEVTTHKAFCAQWGISESDLAATPEASSTTAYGAYLLDIGLQGTCLTSVRGPSW